jgi:hypothetical protein
LNVYCDEIKESVLTNPYGDNEKWVYLGFFLVPIQHKSQLLRALLDARCGNPHPREWGKCSVLCDHHQKNDREIHYQELRRADVFHVAKRWMRFFLADKQLTYLYILGINFTRLQYDYFCNARGAERFYRIYNRFFRTALQKSTKSFFSDYTRIFIDHVFHDTGDIAGYEAFPWHTIYRLSGDDRIRFRCKEIEFIDSKHYVSGSEESYFIQYVDLLLGLTYNCLHTNATYTNAKRLSLLMSEITRRLLEAPGNINSSYKYVNRLCIDFFPKHSIGTENDLITQALRLDSFYKDRTLRIRQTEQPELFDA